MPPAIAPDPQRQNPSGPELPAGAAASMVNPGLGLGLAPLGAEPTAGAPPPPSRRAPRLAKRRHPPASSRSRAPQPQAPAGTWNPFGGGGGGGGGTDVPRYDGIGGFGSGNGGGGGFGKGQSGGFVFGAAPAAGQQPPEPAASPSEAPFVFGSVRESLPRFEEGFSASSKLPDKMEKLNLRPPGEAGIGFGLGNDKKDGSSVFGVDISGLVSNSEVNVLPEKLTRLNLGRGAPLQSEKGDIASGVPKSFVFGGYGVGSFADSRNAAAPGAQSYAPTSVQATNAKAMPEKSTLFNTGDQAPSRGKGIGHNNRAPTAFTFGSTAASSHVDGTSNAASGANSSSSTAVNGLDDEGVLQEKITRLKIGSDIPLHDKKSAGGSHQPEGFTFGSGGAPGSVFGKETSSTSDRTSEFFSANSNASSSSSDFLSTANSNVSNSANCTDNLLPEKTSDLSAGGGGMSQSMESDNANCPPEAVSRRNETRSSVSHSASIAMDDGSNFVNVANTNICSSVYSTADGVLPEKMTKLNIGSGISSQSRQDETATRPPEVPVFGSNISSFSSAHAASTSFTSFQPNVSSQPKDEGRNFIDENIGKSTYSGANSNQGCGTNSFVFGRGSNATAPSEGAAQYELHDEIKKLNINREGPPLTKLNDSAAPDFLFQSKAEATTGFGAVPQPKQESHPFANLNPSSSFSTFENTMPAFSFGTMNSEGESAPDDPYVVKQDLPGCSRESLFGLDSIKSAYRDKKEVHKSKRKNKRPTKLKQHAQVHHAASKETCANGDLAGEYSPMDCSPYPAETEHVPTEEYVASDQSVHIGDGGISYWNSSCADDDLISSTEHLVIDADLPMLGNEGRIPNIDASESSFGSSFSSFEGDLSNASESSFNKVNICLNGEHKTGTSEACADGFGHNINGQAGDENTYRTLHDSGEAVAFQSSSSHFSGLNFSFGASSSPHISASVQRHNTRRKLRTKGTPASKPSTTNSFAQPKSSKDTKGMQFFCETSRNEDSVKEQATRDSSSFSAALEICETWRTSGNKAYENGHFATAEDYYTRGINSIFHHGTSGHCSRALMLCYSNRAATRMSLGMMREALQDCLTAMSIDPSFLKAKVRAANCYLALGDLEDASRSYMSCLDCASNSDPKMFTEASDGLEKVKKVAEWVSQCKDLLEKRTSPEATRAIKLISNALHISPHWDSLKEMKAEALLMLQRYEEVIQLCQESVNPAERKSVLFSANGEPKNYSVSEKAQFCGMYWRPYLICKSYFLSGKLDEALDLLKKHDEVTPVKERMVQLHSDESSYQERFSLLSATIRQLLSLKAAGNELFQAGRFSDAVEQYSAALACNSESRPFSAVCFCNRAAAYQALGQVTDAIADCSLAMVLDTNYPKAISRRATLYEMIRDYGQAANDVRKLILLLEKKVNVSGVSPKVVNKHSDLKQARARLSSIEDEAKKDIPLNLYLILGVEPDCSAADIKKAYRKAALRHHPDKAAQLLVRNENTVDGFWRDVVKEVYADADHLFKTIGEAYNVLSDPDKRQEYDFEEDLRKARKRVSKSRSVHRSPEQNYSNRGFNPRQWQSSRGSRSRWYGQSDDYW